MAENQFRFSRGKQLFITQAELASAARAKSRTVRGWVQKKWLTPHFRLLGGRLQTVFATEEVEAFVNWFFPTLESLDAPCERGSRHDRINSLRAKGRRCAKIASVASLKKHLGDVDGNTQTEQDEDDPETDYQEPATPDRGSARRWDMQPQPPSGVDRNRSGEGWQDSWDDDEEGRG